MHIITPRIILLLFFVLFAVKTVSGQPGTSLHNTGLGGGLAYTSGISAHFYNPANLMIRTHRRTRQITLGMGGLHYSDALPIGEMNRIHDHIMPYFFPENLPDPDSRNGVDIDRLFGDNSRYYQTRTYDVIPVGIMWTNGSSARSLAFRSRGLSSFEMSRTWFEKPSVDHENNGEMNRFLNERYNVFHELSFGFAREVTMFNQWQAGLNTLLVGLAPKIILGGMHSEINFSSPYTAEDGQIHYTQYMDGRLTGDMSRYASEVLATGQPEQAYQRHMSRSSNLDINGAGFGLDAGLTYIIPLGDDISLSPHINEPLQKSLRFSVAITDLGMVRYNNDAVELQSRPVYRNTEDFPETGAGFSGQPGEVLSYLKFNPDESIILDNLHENQNSAFTIILPANVHVGTAFQYKWFVSTLDLNYRFNSSEFSDEGWLGALGTELRLLGFLPLRGSVQKMADGSLVFGAGAGLNFGFLKVSGAVRITQINNNGSDNWHTDAVTLSGLQIRF